MMTSHRQILSCALAILAVSAVPLGGQSGKQSVPAKQKPLPTLSAQEIFKRVSPSVMVVESLDAEGKVTKLGSGVVIAPGSIITNRHVIEGGASFRVEHDGKKWPAKLMKVDPDHDLAELSVASFDAPAVTVLDSSKLAVGETVYAIGSPEGLELTISEGLISGLRDFDKGRVIQTSAAISPGSSGGGLFDARERLVGITTFYLKEGQSLNFALPAEWTLALYRRPATALPSAGKSSAELQALIWFELGFEAFRAGNYGVARGAYERAIRLKPDYQVAWLMLGVTYHDLGAHDKAAEALRRATSLKPDDETAWFELGIAYGSLNQHEKAVSAYQRALALNLDDEDTWFQLGMEYENLGQYGMAADAEAEAVRLKPNDERAWAGLGVVYGDLGKHGKAVGALEEALRLKPDDEDSWLLLGVTFGTLRQYDMAVGAFEAATRLKPGDAEAWYDLGLAFKSNGQDSEVINVYKKLKTLDPKRAEEFFREEVLP